MPWNMSWNALSWNESGGNKNQGPRNPWDRKPENGPPDLDEIVRNLQRRLGGAFGRRGNGPRPVGGGGGTPPVPRISWGLIAAILVGLWAASGFYLVGAAEQAVITRFGAFVGIAGPGPNWHIPWPVESREIVNTQEFRSYAARTRILTQDEALVDINIAVQYRRADPRFFIFNVVNPEVTLGMASDSAIREVIGQNKLQFVLEQGRQEIAARTREIVQRTLNGYATGLEVISVNLQGVAVPEPVGPSQLDAIRAREDRDRLRVEAETYANDILPRARGEAERRLLDANAYRARIVAEAEGESQRFAQLATEYQRAPNVTRQRLYNETMEQVLGNANKIIVDQRGAGNLIYLPLDRLMERRGDGRNMTMPEVTVTPEARGEAADGRGRARGTR